MPRTLSPILTRCLERANPFVAHFVEVSKPDQAKILRRGTADFLTTPPLVSLAPGGSAIVHPSGAVTLASTSAVLVTQFAEAGGFNIPQEDLRTYFNSVAWKIDPAFPGAILRRVSVRLKWASTSHAPDVKLQIYRAVQQAGTFVRAQGSSTVESAMTQVSFAPLLQEPVVVRYDDAGVDGGGFATVVFDLTPYRLAVYPTAGPPPGPGETGELHELYFTVQTTQQSPGNLVEWRYDTTSSRVLAGIGDVRELSWQRLNPDDPNSTWQQYEIGRALTFKLEIEQFVATSQAVYALTLDAVPDASSIGRVVFNRGLPVGADGTMELSTAGSGGPWTAVSNGDVISVAQLTYHARLTMTSSGDFRRAPVVTALGVEFRAKVDVSPESLIEHMAQDVAVPFLAASVAEGRVTVVRTGRRDYRDAATDLAVTGPDTQLEADIYLGSRHPQVTRADWFHTTRALVSGRSPTPTSEIFSLLSIAKKLKRKIPEQVESINSVHTVVTATTTQVQVTPALPGATASPGNEYDGQKYLMRVQSSVQVGVESGTAWEIDGNTGTDTLDFVGLAGTLVAGDVVEVHSLQYAIPEVVWIDQDPADIWLELLTLYLGIPLDRVGLSDVGATARGGFPPTVADRAPGDATAQAKLKVTRKLTDQQNGDELIDQLSFLLGGTTIEIRGQIVFRQIYPLTDALGRITVPNDPVAAVFDARDYTGLDTPTGRERRISLLACAYGFDSTAAIPKAAATIVRVDVDAIASLGLQDVEGLGTATIPEEISAWCFNSADGGELLASMLSGQVVLACGTGVRVWPFTSIDAHPALTVGDSVVVVTDQYTDYDPAQRKAISGWKAYPLTLVGVSDGGRRFKGFLQGLAGITTVKKFGGYGTVMDQPATVPLGMRIERTAAVSGVITVRVYVSDPSPTDTVPIVVTWTAEGVDSVSPASVTLTPPADVITTDLATTAYAEFTINESTTGEEHGRVTFSAERAGRLPVTEGIDISPSGSLPGPSLEVVATPGTTTYSIAYTPASGVQLSIDGGAYGAAPASPIVVTRPAAGANGKEYTFKLTANGQTVTNMVFIPAIDQDTVTPDLQVGPGTTTDTTVVLTPTATNPQAGGPAPTITLTLKGTTASSPGPITYADGSTTAIASGTVITVARPVFGTGAGVQASAIFRASIAGGGAEEIGRTILNQVKLSFGPSLDVVATPGSTSYSITYVAGSGTVQLSISGGAYSNAPASPIVVTRPAVGASPLEYTFRLIVDSQTVTNTVTIQPVDKDTVTPDLVVVPSAPTTTTVTFTVTATNPAGGTAPTITMLLTGTSAAGGYVAGTLYTIASGTVIVADRPAFGTSGQASVEFAATIASQGVERIQRTILNQVKDSFGPSMIVTPTPGPTSYSLAWSGTGTITLSIDGGAYNTPAASPITVTRTSSDKVYTFKAVLDGQTVTVPVTVPAIIPSGGDVTAVVDRIWVSAVNYTTNEVTVDWSYTGSIGGGDFELLRVKTVGAVPDLSGSAASVAITPLTSGVDAVPDDITSTPGPKVTYSYLVRTRDAGSNTVRASNWMSVTYAYV